MNFRECYTRIQNYISDDSAGTLVIIKETINQKALELLTRGLWLWSVREYILTTTSGTSEYSIPRELGRILDMRQTNTPIQLSRVPVIGFDRLVPNPTSKGNPRWYNLLLEDRVKAQPTAAAKIVMYSTDNQDDGAEDGATMVTIHGVAGGEDRIEKVLLSATNEVSSTGSYTKLYSISTDLKPVGSLYFRELTVGTELLVLFPNEISKTYNKIKFYPIPDSSMSIYIKFQATQPRLVNDSDSLVIPERYSNVLVEMVVGDLLLKQGDSKAVARVALAEKGIKQMLVDQDLMFDLMPSIRLADSAFIDRSSPMVSY